MLRPLSVNIAALYCPMESAPFYCFKFLFAQLNSDMSKIIIGTYIGKPEDGIIEIQAPGIQPNTAIAVNGDFSAANEAYVLGVRTPNEGDIMQVMISGVAGTMRINYIYRKS